MRSPLKRYSIYITCLVILCGYHISKETKSQVDFTIYFQDVVNFWQAYDSLRVRTDTTAIFQTLVLDKASEPFKQFIKKNKITARNYALQVKRYPKFYQSIRANSLRLIKSEKEIRTLVQKFRDVYPGLVTADICIAFGNFQTGGTIYTDDKNRIVYIGLEYHGLDSSVIVAEFNESMQDYLSRSNFFRTVIHELVHIQQTTHGKKVTKSYYGDQLVHSILREGVADFVAKLINPKGNDGKYIEYGFQHEQQLKDELRNQLWQKDKSKWIYNSKTENGWPSDMGYFMGSGIANAFYEKYQTNPDVIRMIIEIENVKEFISKSGYFSD